MASCCTCESPIAHHRVQGLLAHLARHGSSSPLAQGLQPHDSLLFASATKSHAGPLPLLFLMLGMLSPPILTCLPASPHSSLQPNIPLGRLSPGHPQLKQLPSSIATSLSLSSSNIALHRGYLFVSLYLPLHPLSFSPHQNQSSLRAGS